MVSVDGFHRHQWRVKEPITSNDRPEIAGRHRSLPKHASVSTSCWLVVRPDLATPNDNALRVLLRLLDFLHDGGLTKIPSPS